MAARVPIATMGVEAAASTLVRELCEEADRVGLYFVPAGYFG